MSEVKALAEKMLSGEIGILAGSRKMAYLSHDYDFGDEAFRIFIALDSETDDCLLEPIEFPISDNRRQDNWRKIKEYEDFYREEILNACRSIVDSRP